MARRCRWDVVTGWDDHAPSLRLTADGGAMSRDDAVRLAYLLLGHADRVRSHRAQQAEERKQHEADVAFEEAEAKRLGRKAR